jgi:PTS system arbutin-like IIC component
MGELGNAATITAMDDSIRFSMLGFGKWFGTIGTVLAFISVAKPEKRNEVRAMLVPAALVAILAGITEPFDFLYLWTSPILYVINAALDGLFQCILFAFGWRALLTGLIETIPGLVALPMNLSNWLVIIPVGAVAVAVWFAVFRFLILKFNLITPGREDEDVLEGEEYSSQVAAISGGASKAAISDEGVANIIAGLGGDANIKKVICCFTRLRCDVEDMSLLDESTINRVKNSGIIKGDKNVQIVIGMSVQDVCDAVNAALGRHED